ncbi:cytochrome c oxidase assembly factor 8 [Arctopsyche grandis]|uniref:cytochrome c oxidase assembly factor 8 n=1 Tax=Arctopsyche grandis TaxID=121162 RepID=UPI00406D96B6
MFRLNIARTMSKMAQSFDLVGPPCPRSHLRPIKLVKSPVESQLQEQYRRARLDLHSWNQAFWASHNTAFVKERELFIAAKSKGETKTLSADEMSIFYKAFLDKNWKTHVNYNVQWYKKNISLFMLSMRVGLENITTKFKL